MAATLTKRPIHVYLRPEQLESLRCQARQRNVSVAELVRQGVDRILEEAPWDEDPLLEIIGLVKGGPGDVAEKHDDYLAQMVQDENR
jgi:hypothetical protein